MGYRRYSSQRGDCIHCDPLAEIMEGLDKFVENAAKPTRILFVDDDPITRQLFTVLSENYNCEVVGAKDYEEVIKILSVDKELDLVILDLKLAGESGIEVFRKLHTIHPNLPVIIFSGFLDKESIDSVSDIGFSLFTPKPNFINDAYIDQFFKTLRIGRKSEATNQESGRMGVGGCPT